MELTKVLLRPLVTEKSTELREQAPGRVAFLVHPDANKLEIRRAVETVFNVTVLKVNVVRSRPRDFLRQGRRLVHENGCKKAYVTLAPDNKIEYFEGA